MEDNNLISIIMPTYNCAKYIGLSIESVLVQTYSNWELIIVDDFSSDNTKESINIYLNDKRIKYIKLDENKGAALARNKAIEVANGDYIAFLDSDDIWNKNKLKKQIDFMKNNNSLFCSTKYEKIDSKGVSKGIIIDNSNIKSYNDLLKNCPGNSTIMYNCSVLGKFYAANIKKRNDYVLWLSIIKKSRKIDFLNDNLTFYREYDGSLSSKKSKLIKYHWYIYRKIEKINFFKSVYLIIYWCLKGIKRITKGVK